MPDTAPTLAPAPTQRSAAELAADLRAGRLSARAVVDTHLARIEALDDRLSAFITVDASGARNAADALDALPAGERGPLHGLPVAIKDLTDTAGLRTTYGSALYADNVPTTDDEVVARLRRAGAVIVAKSNTPEFGFGAVCTNRLRGPTRNPFDLALTSGGSSGGSAVAVATGMVPLAHGTDFGGSVRTPASFCGAVAIRPTPGLIPTPARGLGWDRLASHGVMARSVADCALMLDAIAGPHPLDPTSRLVQLAPLKRPRLAATADFGVAPVSAAVRARFAEAVDGIAEALGRPTMASPDCTGALETFKTLRAAHVQHGLGHLAETSADLLTPTVAWNIAKGADVSARDYLAAETARTALYRRFVRFFGEHDLLIVPAASVLPWPNEDGEVRSIDGVELPGILDYLAVTFIVSLVGFPVLSLPAPQGSHPLPFGLQIIARPGEEALLIETGKRLEAAGFAHRFPPL